MSTNKTVQNIEAHDAAVAEATALYAEMQRKFNARHNAWKKMDEGCDKVKYLLATGKIRDELRCLMEAFGDIDKASSKMHAAAAVGDKAATQAAQDDIVDGINKAGDVSPEFAKLLEGRLETLEGRVKALEDFRKEDRADIDALKNFRKEDRELTDAIVQYLQEHPLLQSIPFDLSSPTPDDAQSVAAVVSAPTPTTPIPTTPKARTPWGKRIVNAATALLTPAPKAARA